MVSNRLNLLHNPPPYNKNSGIMDDEQAEKFELYLTEETHTVGRCKLTLA